MRRYDYVWPETQSFVSSYACKTVPLFGSPKPVNTLFAPIWNLAPLPEQATVAVFSWAFLIILYVLIQNVVPISSLNSSDGQYIDSNRVIISTIVLYYVLSALLVSINVTKGCDALIEQAKSYLYDSAPPIPATLQSSAYAPLT